MSTSTRAACPGSGYELRFRSLLAAQRDFSFPCDDHGRVDLDRLSECARNNYFYARAVVGRDLMWPAVEARRG